MRRWVIAALTCALVSGCIIDRGAIGGSPDAYAAPGMDAASPDANEDAWLDPAIDAFEEPPDAWAPDAWGADAWALDAWAPDAWAPDAPVLPPDAWMRRLDAPLCSGPRCESNDLVACDGTRIGCDACGTSDADGSPHCLRLEASNLPSDFTFPPSLHGEVPFRAMRYDWDTTACNRGALRFDNNDQLPADHVLQRTVGGVDLCIVVAATFRLVSGTVIAARGVRALVIVARDLIEIPAGATLSVASTNTADADCSPATLGAGGGTDPGGPGAGGAGEPNDSGGGGGGFCGRGGTGGGASGVSGGVPGAARPTATLVPLLAGAPGGRGSGVEGGFGGAAGGAVQLSAQRVVVHGVIRAAGASGGGAGTRNAGGGGGSGGGVHLEAVVLDTTGGAIDVRGGGGGGGSCDGPLGSCGGQSMPPAAMSGGAAGGTCGAGGGGAGAAGGSLVGVDGAYGVNGGGAGGGAGCVVLRQHATPATATTHPGASGVLATAAPRVR